MDERRHPLHHTLFHVSRLTSNPLPLIIEMNFQNDDYFSFLSPHLWTELPQYELDWSISDPLLGAAVIPSYTHLPQAAEIPLELPQTFWVSRILRDQEMVGDLTGP